ncbi:MAG TPA: RNA pseudouridine synthase [Alphaproteobacteria bacterium]|jgi:RluA family pseudouridine synthase|nr:RNA pseudouridine synthase [Alphaproteobacteria bacterium]
MHQTIIAETLQSRVLHRDDAVLVLDKPAGLPVHPGTGSGASLQQYLDALRFDAARPPQLAHRLDRQTSGCLVLGRHRKALARLGRLFERGRVEKLYWAVVEGRPPQDAGRIELPLRKVDPHRGWKMVVDPAGQPAVTDYRVLGRGGGLAWLELRPRTGRTHQLRVHCAALGCPILGDWVYGTRDPAVALLHLHARAVTLPFDPAGPPLTVEAPAPPHLEAALSSLPRDCR